MEFSMMSGMIAFSLTGIAIQKIRGLKDGRVKKKDNGNNIQSKQ